MNWVKEHKQTPRRDQMMRKASGFPPETGSCAHKDGRCPHHGRHGARKQHMGEEPAEEFTCPPAGGAHTLTAERLAS